MTTPNRPVIEVRDVVVQYERTVALDHVTLTVPRGRITALLGPNGAGKTTLVDLLEGFARPDAGTVEVLGRDPWRAPAEWRDRIGVVLQDTRLDADLSVAEFIDMSRSWYSTPRSRESALESVGLTHVADRRVHKLSGGERRRLDLAAAMLGRPEVLFLDEPTTGLDPDARREIWSMLLDLRECGQSILLTSHDMTEVERLADHVAVLRAGRIVAEGTVRSLTEDFGEGVTGFRGAEPTFEDVYLHLSRRTEALR